MRRTVVGSRVAGSCPRTLLDPRGRPLALAADRILRKCGRYSHCVCLRAQDRHGVQHGTGRWLGTGRFGTVSTCVPAQLIPPTPSRRRFSSDSSDCTKARSFHRRRGAASLRFLPEARLVSSLGQTFGRSRATVNLLFLVPCRLPQTKRCRMGQADDALFPG